MSDKNLEAIIKNPEGVTETVDEVDVRQRAEQLYRQSGSGEFSYLSDYEAGWITSKAHSEIAAEERAEEYAHA